MQHSQSELIDRIDVHKDRLVVRLRLGERRGPIRLADDIVEPNDDCFLSIPWQKPPSKRISGKFCCPTVSREKRSARRDRNDASVSSTPSREADAGWTRLFQDTVTDAEQIASREQSSARHVSMTISLAFLAPKLVCAAVEEGRPVDEIACRLRQTGRALRCPWRLLRLGHPAVQHHHFNGPADAQCALVLCSVRAGGHIRADQGQNRSLQAQGALGRRPHSPRLRDEGRQDHRRGK